MKTLTQKQIYKISKTAFNNLSTLFNKLGIEYVEYPNRYSFPCPVHGGDNMEGCSIFTSGHSNKGNWQCWTNHCEEEFANNIFGFIRGSLSYRANRNVSLNETESFCIDLFGLDIINNIPEDIEKKEVDLTEVFSKKPIITKNGITRDQIRSKLKIPSPYFLDRGFSKEILDTFDVGLCSERGRPMYNRSVVPVYDNDFNYTGCVGRATNESFKPKWLHSKGFKKCVLYGLNLAKYKILETQSVILVEGQGDVWRMHEAGYSQTVGIFGSNINDEQLLLLENSGALNMVVLTDYDDAGKKAFEQIVKKCGRRFNYYRPEISKKDVGEMSVEEIQEQLIPQLQGVI
jgi:5S rRNA maturation endonuclease (ribonuclease M5)